MIFSSRKDASVDYDGTPIEEWNTEFDCPFVPGGISNGTSGLCWVIYKGLFGKYKIRECEVDAVIFTNCWLMKMGNGWYYFAEDIGKDVFTHDELDKAIRICEEKNRLGRVKVKRL